MYELKSKLRVINGSQLMSNNKKYVNITETFMQEHFFRCIAENFWEVSD